MLALACLLLPVLARGDAAPVVLGELGARLDELLARCATFGFSGTVLVEKDGETVLAKGYGLAERASGRANAVDTVFDVGSLTKQFTAAAIVRLEQDKRLEVTDTLSKFLPNVPADKRDIQLHHLLTHTSGLPRGEERVGSELHDRDELVRILLGTKLTSKPGAQHVYSNVGYDLLAVVVEIAAKMPFETYVRESLFVPAGLVDTTFRGDPRLAARAARAYETPPEAQLAGSKLDGSSEPSWRKSLATEGWYSWGLRGAGGVLSTVGDLQRWQHALAGKSILGEPAKEKLFRPFRDDYAYGWYVTRTKDGARVVEHGGSTDEGFACKMSTFPDAKLLVLVLGNVGGGIVPWVDLDLAALARGREVVAPPRAQVATESELAAIAGVYVAADGARFAVEVDAGAIVLSAENAEALVRLVPRPSGSAKTLLDASAAIAAGLAEGRTEPLHAAVGSGRALGYFDGWWKGLATAHGALREIVVLGAVADHDGAATLLDVRWEDRREILRLLWSASSLTGTRIGPPYPSRLRLVPVSGSRFVRFDLTTRQIVAELATTGAAQLVLKAGGKDVTLRRAPR